MSKLNRFGRDPNPIEGEPITIWGYYGEPPDGFNFNAKGWWKDGEVRYQEIFGHDLSSLSLSSLEALCWLPYSPIHDPTRPELIRLSAELATVAMKPDGSLSRECVAKIRDLVEQAKTTRDVDDG